MMGSFKVDDSRPGLRKESSITRVLVLRIFPVLESAPDVSSLLLPYRSIYQSLVSTRTWEALRTCDEYADMIVEILHREFAIFVLFAYDDGWCLLLL